MTLAVESSKKIHTPTGLNLCYRRERTKGRSSHLVTWRVKGCHRERGSLTGTMSPTIIGRSPMPPSDTSCRHRRGIEDGTYLAPECGTEFWRPG
jgi:hypothetical protein